MGEITVSIVRSKNPNWFDPHQIPKNAAYAIPDEAATRLVEQHHNSVLNDIKASRAKSSNTAFNAG